MHGSYWTDLSATEGRLGWVSALLEKWFGMRGPEGRERSVLPMVPANGLFPYATEFIDPLADDDQLWVIVWPGSAVPCAAMRSTTVVFEATGKLKYVFSMLRPTSAPTSEHPQ